VNLHAAGAPARGLLRRRPRAPRALQALANCQAGGAERLTEELVDRFGPLPDAGACSRMPTGCASRARPWRAEDRRPPAASWCNSSHSRGGPRRVLQLVQVEPHLPAPGPDRVRIDMKHDDLSCGPTKSASFLKKLA